MWYFRAVAFDLDGTLATEDRVSDRVLDALDRTRAERAVLLVTGRIHSELEACFPGLTRHFDAVVTENGAVLRTARGTRLLHEPVDPAVYEGLLARGVPVRRGEVLLAIDGHHAGTASEVVGSLGFDSQVVRNRGAAMVLPAGVTKGSGLEAALTDLGLSAHNTVAVGDAENDLGLLRQVEVGYAVADAVPSLVAQADDVLDRPNGEGVAQLLEGPLLRGHQRFCPPRHWITMGSLQDGSPARLPGSQGSVLITGDTGAGKSYLAGLLTERWIDAGYCVLVVDPEGDHVGLAERPGVHLVDAAASLPSVHDLVMLLEPRRTSVVLDLSGLAEDERLAYLSKLPNAVAARRAKVGVPHWVVYDEAHEQAGIHDSQRLVADAGTCLVTWRPDLLPGEVWHRLGSVIEMAPPETRRGQESPPQATLTTSGTSLPFQVGHRSSVHVRHWHKYTSVPLPHERQFHFRGGAEGSAGTLTEFVRSVRHCDPGTLEFHLDRGDFSRWVVETLRDSALGGEFADIERDLAKRRARCLEQAREEICQAIDRRYRSIGEPHHDEPPHDPGALAQAEPGPPPAVEDDASVRPVPRLATL